MSVCLFVTDKLGSLRSTTVTSISAILYLDHKYLHCRSQLPIVFSKYFTLNKNIHHYNTRSTENLHLCRVSTAREARNIKFKASQLWNTLPEVLKSVQKLSTFKKCLNHYFLNDSVLV